MECYKRKHIQGKYQEVRITFSWLVGSIIFSWIRFIHNGGQYSYCLTQHLLDSVHHISRTSSKPTQVLAQKFQVLENYQFDYTSQSEIDSCECILGDIRNEMHEYPKIRYRSVQIVEGLFHVFRKNSLKKIIWNPTSLPISQIWEYTYDFIYITLYCKKSWHAVAIVIPAEDTIDLLPTTPIKFHGPLTKYVKLRVAQAARMHFTCHRLQSKPLFSDPGMHHEPWCMSRLLIRGGLENVPGIPGAWATHNITYLTRGPCHWKRSKV